MPEPIHILFTTKITKELQTQFQAISPQLKLLIYSTEAGEDIPKRVWEKVEILFSGDTLPPVDLKPPLHWIHSPFAGVDNLLQHPFIEANPQIIITSSSGIHAAKMGEYVLGMMLALAHRVPTMLEHQTRAEWSSDRFKIFMPRELNGSTVGILGYGSIGREVARLAKAFNMTVLATKRNLKDTNDYGYALAESVGDVSGEIADRFYPPEATGYMLKECDFVVIILPLTKETRNTFNRQIIYAMKPGAFLINAARGGIVDETALVEALQSGHLGGAAFDVFSEEPLPSTSPLWKAPNLIISPHIAGNMLNYKQRALEVFEANLRRYMEGQPLINQIDRTLGY